MGVLRRELLCTTGGNATVGADALHAVTMKRVARLLDGQAPEQMPAALSDTASSIAKCNRNNLSSHAAQRGSTQPQPQLVCTTCGDTR